MKTVSISSNSTQSPVQSFESLTMEAMISTAYGDASVLQLQRIPVPRPAANELLIQIRATSVTAAHTAIRTGYPLFGRLFMGLTKPKMTISGTDYAGEVVAVGSDVRQFKVGDEVFGSTDTEGGCYAEYTTVAADGVMLHKPQHITFSEASAIIEGASTAYPFLVHQAQLGPGHHILINGASGSIGTAAIQLAKHLGVEVTGVCSGRNVGMVKGLGADHVIDYTKEDFTQNGIQYDVIFDTVGKSSFGKSRSSLKPEGMYLSPVLDMGLLGRMLWTSLFGKRKAIFMATGLRKSEDKLKEFRVIRELLAEGKLQAVIDRTYHLAQIPEAHSYVEKGHKRGNVVVEMGG
ncbi:MAG: NAD(P)-dependent alcohol dehydrogenase [Bacteroidota bacterium]